MAVSFPLLILSSDSISTLQHALLSYLQHKVQIEFYFSINTFENETFIYKISPQHNALESRGCGRCSRTVTPKNKQTKTTTTTKKNKPCYILSDKCQTGSDLNWGTEETTTVSLLLNAFPNVKQTLLNRPHV